MSDQLPVAHTRHGAPIRMIVLSLLLVIASCAHTTSRSLSANVNKEDANPRKKEASMTMRLKSTGEGEPLVFVGGGLTGWLSWIPHQERLAETRRVARAQPLAVQLGLDDQPVPDGYSIKMESEALAAAIERFHPEGPVDLVGWSYGGHISLDFALDYPERIRSLTLIEPPAFWVLQAVGDPLYESEREAIRPLGDKFRDGLSEDDLIEFVRYASLVPPGARPQDLPNWATWMKHRQSLRGQFDAEFSHRDTTQRLESFDRAVLLVKGKGSTPALHRIVDALGRKLPQARVVEFDGGHAPQIVEMDAFLEELAKFHAVRR